MKNVFVLLKSAVTLWSNGTWKLMHLLKLWALLLFLFFGLKLIHWFLMMLLIIAMNGFVPFDLVFYSALFILG